MHDYTCGPLTSITHPQCRSIQHDGSDVHVHCGHTLDEEDGDAGGLCPESHGGGLSDVDVAHGSSRHAETNIPDATGRVISQALWVLVENEYLLTQR